MGLIARYVGQFDQHSLRFDCSRSIRRFSFGISFTCSVLCVPCLSVFGHIEIDLCQIGPAIFLMPGKA